MLLSDQSTDDTGSDAVSVTSCRPSLEDCAECRSRFVSAQSSTILNQCSQSSAREHYLPNSVEFLFPLVSIFFLLANSCRCEIKHASKCVLSFDICSWTGKLCLCMPSSHGAVYQFRRSGLRSEQRFNDESCI